jgi:hypothetical protein
MLSSLQDITGLFPGLFQRGQSAAAEQAARGQAEAAQLERGRHGRDSLSLSPEAQALEDQAASDDGAAGDAAAAESGSALGQAGGFIRQALETIRHDLAKALKAFGFDSDAVQNFAKAFVEPVLTALKEGVNFTAELTFAAFSQVTTVSSNGDFSQSTSLVAQSLEIEVNHDTGEVSVSLAKLSFEQQIQSGQGGGSSQTPLLVIDPDDLASPQELAAKILASGNTPTAPAEPAPADQSEEAAAEGEADATPAPADALPSETLPGETLEEKLAELRDKLAEDAVRLQTRLTIYSISVSKNDKGETVTKLLLDAQLTVSRLADDATAQEEAQSLNLTA